MGERVSGGCRCGRVRYSAKVTDDDATLCHCRMCQRATGGVAAALKAVPAASVRWSTPPNYFASSPIARRGFCAECGSPLTFEYVTGDRSEIELTVGSFDDPYRFRPVRHYGIESRHEAWLDTRALPGQSSAENTGNTERWIKAVGELPD